MSANPIDAILKSHEPRPSDSYPSRYVLLQLREDEDGNVVVDLTAEGVKDDPEALARLLGSVADSIRNENPSR